MQCLSVSLLEICSETFKIIFNLMFINLNVYSGRLKYLFNFYVLRNTKCFETKYQRV